MLLSASEIQETVSMFLKEKLDVRCITMGISLLDCTGGSVEGTCGKIREKVLTKARDLVKTGESIEKDFGVPIINKRISVTPISLVAAGCGATDYTPFAKTLDECAATLGVNFVGGFSALVQKGFTASDKVLIDSIPAALASTQRVCASVNVASTKSGINMDAVRLMGGTIKKTAELTASHDSIGCAKLVVFCNSVEDNPFMAGAMHGTGEADTVINVGVSGPGVILGALRECKDSSLGEIGEVIKKTAFKITRLGQLVGSEAAKRLGVEFGILDLSLAPTPEVGDSVARIIEEIGLAHTGGPGTTAILAMLTDAVKKGGIMASSSVGGLSGAFIPVSEDEGMIEAARLGTINLEKLEAMTCVCSVGLDMIAIPGSTSDSTISAIIADEMAIGMVNNKTTAVRLIPVIGKEAGEWASFGGLLGRAPIMKVSDVDATRFVERGGHIAPPVHSFRN